jgi:hypothetical protein
VQIPPKTVRARPIETLLEALGGILCGAQTRAQTNGTRRTARAVPRALGRTGGAEQSPMARPLRAGTAAHVTELEQVSWYDLKRSGAPPRHRFHDKFLGGEVALTPMPIGVPAEGRERTGMGRHRRKTGRHTRRLTARAYRALLPATLRRGTASAVPALKTALCEGATRLGGSRARRAQSVLRLDGGVGPTEGLPWLLSRG